MASIVVGGFALDWTFELPADIARSLEEILRARFAKGQEVAFAAAGPVGNSEPRTFVFLLGPSSPVRFEYEGVSLPASSEKATAFINSSIVDSGLVSLLAPEMLGQ